MYLQESPQFAGYRLAANVTPFAWFLLPIITITHVKVQEKNRRRRIIGLVAIKASGREGSMNYSTMLSQQWRIGTRNEGTGSNRRPSVVNTPERYKTC
ncbi:hypothetical protein Y032_0064g3485 [Ancylostoma ceylanicum]|uniref:Uncharacterized protein n=1 Tax=Ancylostoma ceylanicum TaxID=53326 RepID=A0A016U065_9BILA|nr:hypothetical protein Y032_0064g3485 [Ancylostoma ceylanicum]